METHSKTSTFRINSRQLFLTWPQCNISKENALKLLQEKLAIDQYVIAEELHEDKTPHLHAYIKCIKPVDIKNPHKLDLGDFHGNYQSCRSSAAVKAYCVEDGDY